MRWLPAATAAVGVASSKRRRTEPSPVCCPALWIFLLALRRRARLDCSVMVSWRPIALEVLLRRGRQCVAIAAIPAARGVAFALRTRHTDVRL